MATTPKGIYYPNDYNEIADIPEDMKKMAESIDEIFEDTDSDLSDIKAEQTTQNNRLNSLEVDNTTNKSDILTNKQEINNIKTEQTTQNNRLNNLETDNTTNKDNISANTQEINNIKQEQTEQNTNISTNATNIESLQEANENLKKIVSQLPQVTGQGTSITLENTIEAQFTKFDIEGHSEQESTKGYQLLDIYSAGRQPGYTTTINGVTITYNDDGIVKLNGTATEQVDFYIKGTWAQTQKLIDLVVGDIYTVLLNESTSIAGVRLFVLSNGTNVEQNTEKYSTFTARYDGVTGVLLRIENGTALNNYIVSPMIAKGTYTKFEKYTNGASPNPNYEQPIKSAGDNGSINEKINNKNFLPIDENLIFTRSKTINLDTPIHAGTYVLSLEKWSTTGTGASSLINFIGTSNHSFNINNTTYKSRSITLDEEISQIILYSWYDYGSSGGITATIKGLMLSKNGGTYQPHEEQDYPIFVQQPFRSIGDVRDCFVKKSDGWYERHLPYIASYNGETLPQDVYNEVDNVKYCNEKSMSTTGQFSIGASVQYIDENNWNDLPCTPEQVEQLENLPSTYKEMTIINSEDETEAYLEVSGVYDLNKLITRTEVLESES